MRILHPPTTGPHPTLGVPPATHPWLRFVLIVALLEWLARLAVWLLLVGATLWTVGALWFDFPGGALRHAAAIVYALVIVCGMFLLGKSRWKMLPPAVGFVAVLAWWLTLQPSNDRPWQPDVARTAWVERSGEIVTLHNVRNCDYRTETDYLPRWETRTVDLTRLTGLDLAIDYWGSAWIAHPIASFQFDDAPPICFSIETRKEIGESYSAVGRLYRQYELICICADELDVLRVRTNYRQGEEIFLYHTVSTPAATRQRFLEYIGTVNELNSNPRWYNAATTNCTTSIRTQHQQAEPWPWDWRILFNGYLDEMLYERGDFAGGLPFAELKQRARINVAAQAADAAPNFSRRIREGRPGFANIHPPESSPPPINL